MGRNFASLFDHKNSSPSLATKVSPSASKATLSVANSSLHATSAFTQKSNCDNQDNFRSPTVDYLTAH